MSNTVTTETWVLDSVDAIAATPIWIQKIVLIPNATGDAATLKSWKESDTPESSKDDKSCTVTSSQQIVSTGNFPTANVDPGDIIKIWKSNSLNIGTYLINTNADNNTIVAYNTPLTDETGIYSWDIWTPYESIYLLTPTGDTGAKSIAAYELDFGDGGKRFSNLALTALSTSAKVYIYIK